MTTNGSNTVAVFDADGTLWRRDVADDFTLYAIQRGMISSQLWSKYRQMYEQDPPAACVFLLELYKNISKKSLNDCISYWWQHYARRQWMAPVVESLKFLASKGHSICVVSGTPTDFLLPIKKLLPVDTVLGMDFELEKGMITGGLSGVSCIGSGKVDKIRAHYGDDEVIFAVGNSILDAPMLDMSSGVRWAFWPDDSFHKLALQRGYSITEGRPFSKDY